jgi:hypothetical protein
MAKERVQVQGLGRQTPSIRPTIQGVGSFNIATPTAPMPPVPQSNKLIELANTLKASQGLLQQYGLAAEQEAQIFEEELSRKSPEEVQAMLKKTEGELDKQVRRGAMGWLTSPLNQKRKLRAVGKLAGNGLINEIEARMINPNADDPEDLTELANKVRQEYIEKTPSLQTSMFAQEGLNEASNARINALVSNYGRQQEVEAKANTASQVMDTMYQLVNHGYDGSTVSGFKEDGTTQELLNQWADMGGFNAKQQADFLEQTVVALARDGNEVKADAFLEWASVNLKLGNAKMSLIEKSRLSAQIDSAARGFEQLENKQRADLVIDKLGEYKIAHNAIQAGRTGTYNGQEYTDVTQLQLAAENQASYTDAFQQDTRGFTELTDQINNFVRVDADPIERMTQELQRNTPGLNVVTSTFLRNKLQPHLDNIAKLNGDIKAFDILLNANTALQQAIDTETSRLVMSGLSEKEQKEALLIFAQEESNRIIKDYTKDLNTRSEEFDKETQDRERVATTLTESTEKAIKAPERNMFTKMFEGVFGYNVDDGDITEANMALSVLGNKQAPAEEKQKSVEYLKSYGVAASTGLAKKLGPNAWKVEPQFSTSLYGPQQMIKGTGVRYTQEELQSFREDWVRINSFLETFTNLQTLETGVASFLDTTVRFDPTIFAGRTRIARLLTTAELEQAEGITNDADMPTSIKSKAKLIGVDDLVQFVKDQREFAQRLQVIK